LYGSRHGGEAVERVTNTTTATAARRDVDDELMADWRTFSRGAGDFGLNAARLRVVGRLRHDPGAVVAAAAAWDQPPRSSDRGGLQRTTASRSRIDGQSSPFQPTMHTPPLFSSLAGTPVGLERR